MKKKRGGNYDFVHFLIKDKVDSLGFYFIINEINDMNDIKLQILYDNYIPKIKEGYEKCKYELEKNNIQYPINSDVNIKEKIKLFGNYLVKINSKLYGDNTINRYNYGMESYIIRKICNINNLTDNEYFEILKNYISNYDLFNSSDTDSSKQIKIELAENKEYDLYIYIKKIGSDIALYEYIFKKNEKVSDDKNKNMDNELEDYISQLEKDFNDLYIDKIPNDEDNFYDNLKLNTHPFFEKYSNEKIIEYFDRDIDIHNKEKFKKSINEIKIKEILIESIKYYFKDHILSLNKINEFRDKISNYIEEYPDLKEKFIAEFSQLIKEIYIPKNKPIEFNEHIIKLKKDLKENFEYTITLLKNSIKPLLKKKRDLTDLLKEYLNDFFGNFNVKKFQEKLCLELNKLKKENNISFSNNNDYLCQQCFNIYTYEIEFINDIAIIYNNHRIIKCDFPEELRSNYNYLDTRPSNYIKIGLIKQEMCKCEKLSNLLKIQRQIK